MSELRAMIRKEWLELRQGAHGGRSGLMYQTASAAAAGVLVGVASQESLLRTHRTTLVLAICAAASVLPFIIDTIAGERERHTLEALLATPIRAGTLVAGKVITLMLYASASTALLLATAMVAARIAGGIPLQSASATVVVASVVTPPLLTLAFVATGIQLSLRAATVRGAQPLVGTLLIAFMIVPLGALRLLPRNERVAVLAALQDTSDWQRVGGAIGLLLVIDVMILLVLRLRFARHKLVALIS